MARSSQVNLTWKGFERTARRFEVFHKYITSTIIIPIQLKPTVFTRIVLCTSNLLSCSTSSTRLRSIFFSNNIEMISTHRTHIPKSLLKLVVGQRKHITSCFSIYLSPLFSGHSFYSKRRKKNVLERRT